MSERPRFEVEIILANGVRVTGTASQEDAEHMLATKAYVFRREMTDAEKQRAAIETQIAFSIEKDTGVFVMADASGGEWLLANQMIVGGLVRDSLAEAPPRFGFRTEQEE